MVLETDLEDDACSGWRKDLAQLRRLVGTGEPIKAKRNGQARLG